MIGGVNSATVSERLLARTHFDDKSIRRSDEDMAQQIIDIMEPFEQRNRTDESS